MRMVVFFYILYRTFPGHHCYRYMLSEDVQAVVESTAQIAEVDVQSILSDCRQSEVVEARMIAIHILSQMGYSPQRLAKYFHKTEQGIRLILSMYEDRHKGNILLSRIEKDILKKVESKCQLID